MYSNGNSILLFMFGLIRLIDLKGNGLSNLSKLNVIGRRFKMNFISVTIVTIFYILKNELGFLQSSVWLNLLIVCISLLFKELSL